MAKKILIVDDATIMRLMLKHLFENNDFEVVGEAANGVEAVELYSKHKPRPRYHGYNNARHGWHNCSAQDS